MKLDIILRTHSIKDVHKGTRIVAVTKEELVLRCAKSLVRSINSVSEKDHDIILTVIDDHSSKSCIAGLKKIISSSLFTTKIIPLENTGNRESLKACYDFARDFGREIIYFVEDDYLHFSSAIPEMIEAHEEFKKNLGGREVAVLPNDDPNDYRAGFIEPSRLVASKHRHWRTNTASMGTFMLSHDAFVKNWEIFMQFTKYGTHPMIHEGSTIDKIWRGGVTLFTPIPALAIHMQYAGHNAPFVDWHNLWDENKVY